MLNFKRRIWAVVLFTIVALSVYAMSYQPDEWTYCLDQTAEFVSEGTPTATGVCVYIGEYDSPEGKVDLTQCQNEGFGASGCTGNSLIPFASIDE